MFQIRKLTSLTGFMFKQKQRANSAHAHGAKYGKGQKKNEKREIWKNKQTKIMWKSAVVPMKV